MCVCGTVECALNRTRNRKHAAGGGGGGAKKHRTGYLRGVRKGCKISINNSFGGCVAWHGEGCGATSATKKTNPRTNIVRTGVRNKTRSATLENLPPMHPTRTADRSVAGEREGRKEGVREQVVVRDGRRANNH